MVTKFQMYRVVKQYAKVRFWGILTETEGTDLGFHAANLFKILQEFRICTISKHLTNIDGYRAIFLEPFCTVIEPFSTGAGH